jgi:hypothetical protein
MRIGSWQMLCRALGVSAAAIGLTLVFWLPLWKGGGLIGGDTLTYFFPQKTYLSDQLAHGHLPLWNNLSGHGYPVIAESQTGLCYPPTLLLYWLADVNTAYNANFILHYIVGFVFAWLYATRVGLSPVAAGLAALVFVYGWFPPRMHFEWSFLTGVWLPVVLWCAESFLQTQRRAYLLLLSLSMALQLLAGHFALAFITQVALVASMGLRLWFGGGKGEGERGRGGEGEKRPATPFVPSAFCLLPSALSLRQPESPVRSTNSKFRASNAASRVSRLGSMFTTMHWLPNRSAASWTNCGFLTAAELIETLSQPACNNWRISSSVRIPPPTVSGMNTTSDVRRTTSRMISRSSWLAVMSRKTNSSAPCSS